MLNVSERDRRTVRLAAIGIALYLALFFGIRGWRALESSRAEYHRAFAEAQRLKRDLRPFENRLLQTEKLRETFRFHPAKLSRNTLVADTSAAIQDAAKTGGVQLGPVRESAARASGRELASMQLEGVGPVPAVMTLLHRLETLGFPLILDSLQLTPEPTKPGNLKMNVTIVILDYEHWQKPEAPRA